MENPKDNCWLWRVCRAIAARRSGIYLYHITEGDKETTNWLGCRDCGLASIMQKELEGKENEL